MKELDQQALAQGDGKEGRPALVAYQGRVVDVTGSKRWPGGLHLRRHQAGADLTADLAAAPHGPEMLERFPQVGTLAEPKPAGPAAPPSGLERLVKRFPMLRRHPHPMTVHFPIVFAMAAAGFSLLAALTGRETFGTTAFHCLGAGFLTTPGAVLTGYAAWKINYLGRPMAVISRKMVLSVLLLAVFAAAFAWRLAVPEISERPLGAGAGHLLLVLTLVPLVSVLGWLGASLTFPVEKR
ncbi:MAG: cytochrome b5 [Deltaproteobacteria bacterium]|nr:cytochrome b5 [Deltaproteobacteria bacterium]